MRDLGLFASRYDRRARTVLRYADSLVLAVLRSSGSGDRRSSWLHVLIMNTWRGFGGLGCMRKQISTAVAAGLLSA
jgi:hypothetical protein